MKWQDKPRALVLCDLFLPYSWWLVEGFEGSVAGLFVSPSLLLCLLLAPLSAVLMLLPLTDYVSGHFFLFVRFVCLFVGRITQTY